jgi:hypothetical protein
MVAVGARWPAAAWGCHSGGMASGPGGAPQTGWSAIRPVLVAFLLAADAFVVAVLAIAHPRGWLPPFIAFGAILAGLVGFEVWAIRHRGDDAR